VRILMVDDNAHGLTARKSVLEEQGHVVTTANGPQEALEIFAVNQFDLLITDYRMPRMNGLELIAAVRAESPTIRIILLSGFVETLGLTEQSTGADGVLQKSAHEVPNLIRMVARVMLRKAPARKPAAAEVPAPLKAKRKTV
jgi:CheY-like chemotaxis protein